MPRLELSVRSDGLLFEARVWFIALRREQYFKLGKDVPPAAYAVLIVDTGADTTMINEQLLRNLGR